METKTGPILIGLAYLALVVFIIVFCANLTSTFEEYSQYWGLFGTLIGVATGAIPGFFFKAQADRATEKANTANEEAANAGKRAELYASAADPAALGQVQAEITKLF